QRHYSVADWLSGVPSTQGASQPGRKLKCELRFTNYEVAESEQCQEKSLHCNAVFAKSGITRRPRTARPRRIVWSSASFASAAVSTRTIKKRSKKHEVRLAKYEDIFTSHFVLLTCTQRRKLNG